MKTFGHFFSTMALAIICVVLTGAAAAQVFDNGPVNGTVDAWDISYGYSISDSFLLENSTQLTAVQFWVWEFQGDQLNSVDWQLSSSSGFSCGLRQCFGTASQSQGLLIDTVWPGEYGYQIDLITVFGLPNGKLAPGTYWLTLHNAKTLSGDPVFWDENSGAGCKGWRGTGHGCPSLARELGLGSIPSESFRVFGF